MKKIIVCLAAAMLLLAACDPRTRTNPDDLSRSAGEASESATQVDKAGDLAGPVDDPERDLQQALAGFKAAAVQRQGGLLDIVLRGDACFAGGSDNLKQEAEAILDGIVQGLSRYPRALLLVEGHTDNQGTDSHNMTLSYHRARAVKAALVQRGIDDARIQAQGFGRAAPVAANDTEAGRQLNRRLVIKVEAPAAGR